MSPARVPMDDAHLVQYAVNTAKAVRPAGIRSARVLAREVKENLARCARVQEKLSAQNGEEELSGGARWLLDNYYLAAREGEQARRCFQQGGTLRGTQPGNSVLQVCARGALWAVPDLEAQRLRCYLEGFQSVCPLMERELSLLVSVLAGTLLERLGGLCAGLEGLDERAGEEEMAQIFQALRALSEIDWGTLLEETSQVERLLSQDPSGCYPQMDEESRRRCRQRLCQLAKQYGLEEKAAAQRVLELAQKGRGVQGHVSWYLYREPLGKPRRLPSGAWYAGGVVLLTLVGAAALGWLWAAPLAALLLVLPLSDIVKNVGDFLLSHFVPPRPVLRLELEEGIPPEGRTLCVVSALLTGPDSGAELAGRLELGYLCNRDSGQELAFGILADLPDCASPMNEERSAWVDRARKAVEELNRKYEGGFYLLFREPTFSAQDERYMGWERKRGALVELVRLIRGRSSGLRVEVGEKAWLSGVKLILTLDSDTCLTVGSARALAGAMLHPLNRPVVDEKRKIVVSGYGLFQPRVGVELEAANRSLFSRVFGGLGGVDPYGWAASDVYHDLFDQGSYTGKGIFDVEAFDTCLEGRFPQGQILSHDLLEGSYLRAGLLGEVELTDGCPYQVRSYFARLHRWIRGDWQLLPWLGRRVPAENGTWEENPLPILARWKIADNLRRSLSPIVTFLALMLGLCVSGRVFALAGTVAVLSAASNLLLSGAEAAARPWGRRRRYHSTVISGVAGVILQTAIQLLFLPYQAWISAWAICCALWRMKVSHKNLLAWVTAAQAEQRGNHLGHYIRSFWFSLAMGAAVLVLAPLRVGKLVGLVWLLAPLLAYMISRPAKKNRPLSPSDRAFLLHQAALIWRYFAHFLRAQDHYLPPDNYQEQPGPVLARRTSPTNIGLGMLSVMGAADLGFIPRQRSAELLGHMLDTVERLEKWQGHLYNWYNTQTLAPLNPRYVSTVDSGNLRGCLIALREGLRSWGEEALAHRAEVLEKAMDCSPLYDRRRRLFSIGYEVEQGRMTAGHYDLMASEARQTSFIALARGEVPLRHWRCLGRMLLGDNDYSGMASWTGTMFEYFMPQLLLPCEPNSFLYETLSFCVYAQKRRGSRTKTPWGISESGFYAFDPGMNYQYKAHGVQALGLKWGLDSELVISPYSSFLALLLAPHSALRNLRRLRDMGLEGRFGLYEAVDYTPSRLSGDGNYEVVRSYMSHHLGMSLLAIVNALEGNLMQRRFLADRDMAAYRTLLQERVPVGAPILRQRERQLPEEPRLGERFGLERKGTCYALRSPACHLVSNGSYHVFCQDNGLTSSRLGERQVLLARPGEYYAPVGVAAFFRREEGLLSLTPAPLYQKGEYGWYFHAAGASWEREEDGLLARMKLSVPRRENGELRRLELSWRGSGRLEGELLVYLEPVLCPMGDFLAHPAFSRLFLESELTQHGAVFRRRPRGTEGEVWLAALWEGNGETACLDRALCLGRGGLRALAGQSGPIPQGGTGTDPCLMVRFPISLEPGEKGGACLALGVGDSRESAVDTARRVLQSRNGERGSLAALALRLHLNEGQTMESFRLLERLAAEQKKKRPPREQVLWPYGISGDFPIAAGILAGEEDVERAGLWCRWHQLLSRSGFPFDLVLLTEEGGDYRRPRHAAVARILKELGAESALGARGGIHLVDRLAQEGVLAWAGAVLPLEREEKRGEHMAPPPPVCLKSGPAPWSMEEDGSLVIRTGQRLPPVGWSQILCNPNFGWLTDETGEGFLWAGGNSREGKLTPWDNDPLTVGGRERITLTVDGAEYSVFADGDRCPCTVIYRPGLARWEKNVNGAELVTEGFVPPEENCRYLTFTLTRGRGILSCRLGERTPLIHTIGEGEKITLLTRPGDGEPVYEFSREDFDQTKEKTMDWWAKKVSSITFSTPDKALDRYLGGWCLYQVIACRLMGRTSRYQNGGAFGFRDQLQDVLSLLYTWPERTREQLLLAASRQFEEGDVQHWWHPPQGAGVRTRISDDLLWLPYVLSRYCTVTGDWDVLGETVPYLTSPVLAPGELERYELPQVSEKTDCLYRHALSAIRCALERGVGDHGLAKMGTGDWNDGMNRVGERGDGESVWLSWFLALVLQSFAPLCRRVGEDEEGEALLAWADRLVEAAQNAWDGGWYRRGYFDDGTPLGSAGSDQCQIDSIAQSFAAFPQGSDREQAHQAISAALERLFDRERGVVRLFAPAFDMGGSQDPGYIKSYPAGVRENGGQYTHGALWLAIACLRLGRPEEGWAIWKALLPQHHPTQIYRGEPNVLSADVSYAPGLEGRAGWTWYTGAAGWYWQGAVEELLGLRVKEGKLTLRPNLPESWPGFTAVWRLPKGKLTIVVKRTGAASSRLDGQEKRWVELEGLEGDHELSVTI